MAKPLKQPQVQDGRKVRIFVSKLFLQTLNNFRGNEQVLSALKQFLAAKRSEPIQPFGSKDYPFKGDLKAYKHAGLTFDAQVVYSISGRDPHVIRLYGVYTHDQLGTGNPARMNLQQKAAKSFDNTHDFSPLEKVDESTV